MKKLLVMLLVSTVFNACNNAKDTPAAEAATTRKAVSFSLPIGYSTSFEMGDQEKAAMIVQGSWKDWQQNTMDNMRSWMADSIVAFQSNGKMLTGIDSVTANWKRGRNMYSSIVDSIDAAMAVVSTDKNENWVLIWATEYSTEKTGKNDTIRVMETWRLNKDGKADMLLQFDRHTRKM